MNRQLWCNIGMWSTGAGAGVMLGHILGVYGLLVTLTMVGLSAFMVGMHDGKEDVVQ